MDGGWAVWLAGNATVTIHGEGWEESVRLDRRGDAWLIGDESNATPLSWWRDQAGVWTIAAGETVVKLAVHETEGGLEVAGAGGRWLVALGHRPTSAPGRQQARTDGRIRAPMPGRILDVMVAPGERVSAEQPLVLLTAMKMELSCAAPAAGRVSEVRCGAGDQVEAHQVLVELQLDATDEESVPE